MCQVHRFSLGCCKHAHIAQGAQDYVRDVFKWVHVGVDDCSLDVRKRKGRDNICGWRPSPALGASGPLAKAKRKYPAAVELLDAVQLEDVQKFLPEGCRMEIDRLDRSWRLAAWANRTTEAWSEEDACEGSPLQTLKL